MSEPTERPAAALFAATILLIRDDPLQVLMVKRRAASVFASALVFPGGVVEAEDADSAWLAHLDGASSLRVAQRALRIAGCREVFEEVGVLLASGHSPIALPRKETSFLELVRRLGVRLDLGSLLPFGHWITPENALKRFDTHFFICAAPEGIEARADGEEAVSVEWVTAADAVAAAAAGTAQYLFPTLMNLRRLAESADVATALHRARAREVVTVQPRVEERTTGRVIVIPEAAGYGVTEFAMPAGVKIKHG